MIAGPLPLWALVSSALVSSALAARPTDNTGLYAFDESDVVETLDGPAGLVRVHYSVKGPNVVRDGDDDPELGGDGLPDFAQEVAATAEAVLLVYEETGLRLPLSEAEMGLPELGGSDALDFYLVDFDFTGDGQFGVDSCQGGVCSGYMVMENDFSGYGYSSISTAIRTLTSHELFHGVQYAYLDDLPGWMAEGTAMWSELHFDPDSDDFVAWCDRYLEEPDRGLDRTPSGAFTGWEYGTGLFFGFLDLTLGSQAIVALMEALAEQGGDGALDALDLAIVGSGSSIEEVWTTFGTWNLATGDRAGLVEGYPFADELAEVQPLAEGDSLVDDQRVYPLATAYLYLEHGGGELWFGTPDDPTGLALRLHASTGGQDDPVEAELGTWWPDAPGALSLGELPAGDYWILLSQPGFGDSSIAIDYCLGDLDTLDACVEDGGTDTGGDSGDPEDEGGGCGCASGAIGAAGAWSLLLPLWTLRRRRR
ncbi:hypothetical protein L6R53_24940 [Myxococcota bacterium]|nr:hypothetical protein [Myxococcota bacterium]